MAKTTRLFSRSMGRWLMALLLVMLSSLAMRAAEAYACYTSSNTTLTFYYDTERSSRTGTTYDLNTGSQQTGWYVDETYSHVTQVVIDPSFVEARPTSTYMWFYGMENVHSITGLNYLNTENVTNMGAMFMGCSGFTSLDLSHFNTTMVTDMFHMFYDCSNLTSLDVSSFNTAGVQDMRGMFRECSKLTSLDLSNFNTANVEIMNQMFSGDTQLVTIYVGQGWSTESLNYSYEMFENCTSLVGGQGTTYDANHMDAEYAHIDGGTANPGYFTEKVPETEAYACYTPSNTTLTFYYDSQRASRPGTTYDLNTDSNNPDWYSDGTSSSVTRVEFAESFADVRPTSTYSWFYEMPNLVSITGMEYLITSEVTKMCAMFMGCSGLTNLDVSHFDTGQVTDMSHMFQGCSGLTNLDVSGLNTAKVTDMAYMFAFCSGLTSLDVSNFNTTNVTDMYGMFQGCSGLTSIDVSTFNTANVNSIQNMFCNCTGLTSLDVSNFNTVNAVAMNSMFSNCTGLTSLDLSNFNTSNVTEMRNMFYGCTGLTSLDFSTFNTANVNTMNGMFQGCSGLTSLDVSSFNTANVNTMNGMFQGCSGLTTLDVSNFNTAKVRDMAEVFESCNSITTIYAGDGWSTAAVITSRNMFKNCTNLVGGMGTTYDANHVDASYAHIDGGPSNPGYFTEKPKEAYACYTPSNTTLTFYYDNKRATRTGRIYDLNTGSNYPDWYSGDNHRVTQAVFDPSFADARPTTTYRWFAEMEKLLSIEGLEYLNTSCVTDMREMFQKCNKLTSLDVSGFNTANVTSMYYMFDDCYELTTLDVSNFNTANVTNMGNMFGACYRLTSLDLSNFNTANVTNMHLMFFYCRSMTSLDLSSFNTSNVQNMGRMFEGCSGLTSLDVSNFNTAKVNYMSSMFQGCSGLTSLDLNNFNTEKVIYMKSMFRGCSGLTSLDVSSFNTAKVTDMSNMFYNCGNLTTIYVGDSWSTAAVTSSTDMFLDCTALVGGMGTTYDPNHVDAAYAHLDGGPNNPGYLSEKTEAYACYTPSNTTLTFYYDGQRSSRTGTTYDLNTGSNHPSWYTDGTNADVTKVTFDPSFADARPTSTYRWFYGMSNLTSITGLNLLNTSEVTMMFNMFRDCSSLTSLDVSNFNTAKVTNMGCMFQGCSALTSLDVSGFNTANVTVMQSMFQGCSALTSLDLSSFNTAKVIMMDRMFYGCTALTSVDLSSFNTSKVTDMQYMFYNCSALPSLDLSSFNTAKVTYMEYMFSGSSNLRTIYVSDSWSTAAVTSSTNMFQYCTSLVGGMGTTWKFANPTNKTYAHVDGGSSNPGYFTYKPAFIRGDVNNDGNVTIVDVTLLINYLLSNDATGINLQGADTTLNEVININDVTFLINYLLSGSW